MCYSVIPGKTGCLAIREVILAPKKKTARARRKVGMPNEIEPIQISIMILADYDELYSHDETPAKKNIADKTYSQYKRNTRAKNATRHRFARPSASRKSVRRILPQGPTRKISLADLMDELLILS